MVGNMHCLMLPLNSSNIEISVVSQCRILVPVQDMNTLLFNFFQLTTQRRDLHLLNCTVTWSLTLTVDSE